MQTQSNRKRFSKKIYLRAFTLLIFILTGIFVGYASSDQIAKYALTKILKSVGLNHNDISVVQVNWSDKQVVINGIQADALNRHSPFVGRTILSWEWAKLFSNKPTLSEVDISEVAISVTATDEGWSINGLPKLENIKPNQSEESSFKAGIEKVSLANSKIHLHIDESLYELFLEEIYLEWHAETQSDIPGSARIKLRINGIPVIVALKANAQSDQNRVQLALEVKDLDTQLLTIIPALKRQISDVSGNISLNSTAEVYVEAGHTKIEAKNTSVKWTDTLSLTIAGQPNSLNLSLDGAQANIERLKLNLSTNRLEASNITANLQLGKVYDSVTDQPSVQFNAAEYSGQLKIDFLHDVSGKLFSDLTIEDAKTPFFQTNTLNLNTETQFTGKDFVDSFPKTGEHLLLN